MTAGQKLGQVVMSPEDRAATLQKEYDLVNGNFRQLSEIRFKLLGFVPSIGGVANFALTQAVLSRDASDGTYWLALVFGMVGFLATLGVAMYDQRNSELYAALIKRAKYLEAGFGLPHMTKENDPGGQFRERPDRSKRLFGLVLMGHDGSLALIYGPVLGAWFFPLIYSFLKLKLFTFPAGLADRGARIAVEGAVLTMVIFVMEFLRLDKTWRRIWQKLWP